MEYSPTKLVCIDVRVETESAGSKMGLSTYSQPTAAENRCPAGAISPPSQANAPRSPYQIRRFEGEVVALIPSLRLFALALTGNAAEADDLVQESLLKALSHAHQFKLGTNLRAWLFTIQRNTHYTRYARRRKEASCGLGETAGLGCEPGQEWMLKLKTVDRAMQQLPHHQREALMLVGGSGFSYEEAARICGCALGTIRSRINRGRTRLLELLGAECNNDFLYDDQLKCRGLSPSRHASPTRDSTAMTTTTSPIM